MKVSEHWLREWVNPPLISQELAEQLTLAGLEVAAITPVGGSFTQVIVGQIVAIEPHPNASRLQVCHVDIGAAMPLTIVCGAKNPRVGLKVAVAQVGAQLANNVLIKEAALRGVMSQGMLCSSSELLLSESAEGILELPHDAPIAKDLRDYLQLDDHCFDVHITPNRGDCLSVKGLARDIAAITASPFTSVLIDKTPVLISDKMPIQLEAPELCPHYCGRIIRGINPHALTPLWLAERLRRSGLRCIHPVVDISNYVMLELGQPLHAFDLAKLDTTICVRLAKTGEKLTLLDDKTVVLDNISLVIADKTQVHAIAGVMGGLHSAVSATTQDIFLESAFFTPAAIAGRARHYGLNSDAAYRFERGVDPAITEIALERATQLLLQIVGGKAGPIQQVKQPSEPSPAILFHLAHLKKCLGFSVPEKQIALLFQHLGIDFIPTKEQDVWQVTAPTWRFDLALEVDLMEEVARITGYQKIPLAMPYASLKFLPQPDNQFPLSRIKKLLVDRGYHEAINYSFTAAKLQNLIDPQQSLRLLNPLSHELSVMRTSLWPGLLNSLRYNQQRQCLSLRLFETGLCFQYHDNELQQIDYLAGVASGDNLPEQWGITNTPLDFFTIKSDIEALFALTGQLTEIQFMPGSHPALHPGQSACLQQAGKVIGHVGALHPKLMAELDLIGPVYCFELLTTALTNVTLAYFKRFSKFPLVRRDLAFWIDEKYPAQTILDKAKVEGGEWLNHCYVFDVYYDKVSEKKKRSLALALYWQHPARTLVDTEVDALMQKLIATLQSSFAIQLRE